MYDGTNSPSLLKPKEKAPPEAPPPPPAALIVEAPPFTLTDAEVVRWATSQNFHYEGSLQWAVGPSGSSCAWVEVRPRPDFSPPPTFPYRGRHYKLTYLTRIPPSLTHQRPAAFLDPPVSLRDCLSSETPFVLPEGLESALLHPQ